VVGGPGRSGAAVAGGPVWVRGQGSAAGATAPPAAAARRRPGPPPPRARTRRPRRPYPRRPNAVTRSRRKLGVCPYIRTPAL